MLEIKEIISKKIWENFLITGDAYPFFQSWKWGEVQKELGFPILRIGLYDNNNLVGVLQIVKIRAKRGHYLYLRHGPVVKELSQEYFDEFLRFVCNLAKQKQVSFVRLSRFPKSAKATEYFRNNNFHTSAIQTVDAQVCWVLNITKSEEELLKSMRKSHRYLIKKSQISEIKIIKTKGRKDLESFLPLYKELSARKHFVAHKGIVEEFDTFAKADEEVLFLAMYENKIIAGAIIAFVGNTAIYRHSASDEAYKHIPASYRIQWEAIKEAKNRKKTLYNFWGIAPLGSINHPWKGLTLFKTGFGGGYEEFLPTLDLPLKVSYMKTYLVDLASRFRKEHGI